MFAVFSTCFKSPFCFGLFWNLYPFISWYWFALRRNMLGNMKMCYMMNVSAGLFYPFHLFWCLNLYKTVCCFHELFLLAILFWLILSEFLIISAVCFLLGLILNTILVSHCVLLSINFVWNYYWYWLQVLHWFYELSIWTRSIPSTAAILFFIYNF